MTMEPGKVKGAKWRNRFLKVVFPRLLEFKPEFIFISAGFDAHERDSIHRSTDTKITEFDYQWVTENLVKIANTFANGRIVSVMEGGYNTSAGPLSPLAQSIAFHVRALLNGTDEKMSELTEEQEKVEKYRREKLKERRPDFI